ncbi:MAG: LCP family protein [Naasia sp.]
MTEEAVARHGRMPRRGPLGAGVRLVAIVAAVALVSTASIAAIGVWDISRQIETVEVPEDVAGPVPAIGPYSGGFNMLLVGSDYRSPDSKYSYGEDDGTELNDVNILLHVSDDHTNAVAISFPRDMRVPLPECDDGEGGTNGPASSQPINTALFAGGGSDRAGLACVMETVSDLTGLDIPFAAMISFDGVIEMSNAVGGVEVCVAQRLQDTETELDLAAGVHELQGMDALKFLRTRKGVGDGSDLTRIGSQQVFLSSLIRKVKSSETLGDVTKLYGLAGAAVGNMRFTESLSNVDTMVAIARSLQPIPLDRIAFVQYPAGESESGLVPNYDSARVLLEAVQTDQAVAVQAPPSDDRGPVADPNAAAPAPDAGTDGGAQPEGGAVVLPDDVRGQSAAESRCAVGRALEDQ